MHTACAYAIVYIETITSSYMSSVDIMNINHDVYALIMLVCDWLQLLKQF